MSLRLAGAVLVASTAAGMSLAAPTNAPRYRDLNHNGRLDPYEDRRLTPDVRADDLVRRMTVEEKVGTLLHGTLPAIGNPFGSSDKGYDLPAVEVLLRQRHITSMISRLSAAPAEFARQNNAVQKLAEGSRLGIPVTISSDPRNHFSVVAGASNASAGFSQWPEPLGLAALGSPALVRHFATVAAGEYRAVGLHMALSPQADLASEPRWSRSIATFGSDPAAVSALAGAYVEGFQGGADGLRPNGVATVVKHWAGYGAEPEGFDAHSYFGRRVVLSNATFARHVAAFDGALKARAAGVMPTYAIVEGVTIDGKPLEPVGAGFSRQLLADLLRGKHRYDGLLVSDWGIANDCPEACRAPTAAKPQGPQAIGMPWGVEALSVEDRVAKAVNAGMDQFGGLDDPAALLAAVRDGRIAATRLDQSVRRAMVLKFRLGLFDNPYVDPATAGRIVGASAVVAEAQRIQARALVLLENRRGLLTSAGVKKVKAWIHGIDPAVAQTSGFEVVADPAQAEIAILRISAPYEHLHPHAFFGAMQKEGRLDFRDGDVAYEALKSVAGRLPTVVAVDLDRPAILTAVRDKADVLLGVFGASDRAVLDVVAGRVKPEGRLPLELPRDMVSVDRQKPDVSDDSINPLYPRGYGLRVTAR